MQIAVVITGLDCEKQLQQVVRSALFTCTRAICKSKQYVRGVPLLLSLVSLHTPTLIRQLTCNALKLMFFGNQCTKNGP